MIHPTVLTEIDLRNGRAQAAMQAGTITPEEAAADAELWRRVAQWAQAHDAGARTMPPVDAARVVNNTMARALQRAPLDRHSLALVGLSRTLAAAIDVWRHDDATGFGPAAQAHTAALQAAQQEERKAA